MSDDLDVEVIYRRYGPMVLRRCRRLLGDEEQALDVMQDTFVQVLRHHDLVDRGASSLLYRIATNLCLNRIRSRQRNPVTADTDVLERIAALDKLEEQSAARNLLARLLGNEPISTGVIAVLHLLDGLTLEQVADEVGLSVSGVRKRLRKLQAAGIQVQGGGR